MVHDPGAQEAASAARVCGLRNEGVVPEAHGPVSTKRRAEEEATGSRRGGSVVTDGMQFECIHCSQKNGSRMTGMTPTVAAGG